MDRVKIGGKTQGQLDAEKREEDRVRVNDESRAYLRETDWYIIRQVETGLPTPEAIGEKRREARGRVVEQTEQ